MSLHESHDIPEMAEKVSVKVSELKDKTPHRKFSLHVSKNNPIIAVCLDFNIKFSRTYNTQFSLLKCTRRGIEELLRYRKYWTHICICAMVGANYSLSIDILALFLREMLASDMNAV